MITTRYLDFGWGPASTPIHTRLALGIGNGLRGELLTAVMRGRQARTWTGSLGVYERDAGPGEACERPCEAMAA